MTDISWREPETDRHLRALAAAGVRIYWIDHHRTALERFRAGLVDVPFAGRVLSEDYAASRLVYEYLRERGDGPPRFAALAPLIALADDNDRWLHRLPGSRELAWTVRALGEEARAAIAVALGLVVVLFVSGLIEGLVTGNAAAGELPIPVALGIGTLAEALFLIYVFTVGRKAHQEGETGDIEDAPAAVPVAG